tara:strand:- start:151 stop:609 length:459 start_codon:yes stop_codon:yes gene_type:complete
VITTTNKSINDKTANMSIYAVHLYKLYGQQWVFDDVANDIIAEAFIAGADRLLDHWVKDYDPNNTYILQFSEEDFPGSKIIESVDKSYIRKLHETDPAHIMEIVDTGTYWSSPDLPSEKNQDILWLCPTLDVYFDNNIKLLYYNILEYKKVK